MLSSLGFLGRRPDFGFRLLARTDFAFLHLDPPAAPGLVTAVVQDGFVSAAENAFSRSE